jgi:hypothetical protein
MEVEMICHTENAKSGSGQLTHKRVSNGLPHTPNVPLSCADMRHTSVNLRKGQALCLNFNATPDTVASVNTKSNRSHGGSSGRISPAPQVLLREAGARITVCTPSYYCHRNGNRGWRLGSGQDTRTNSRGIGASSSNGAENAEAALAPQQAQVTRPIITTENIGDGSGSRSEVQLRAFAARVHDKLSGFLGYHAGARSERSAYARTGTRAHAGADLQPRRSGRSAPHSQEAVIALLAFGTVAAAYSWAVAALWVLP